MHIQELKELTMSRIDDSIAEYCPDGVEYKRLGDVCKIKNGKDYKHLSAGDIPVYGSGGVMDVRVDTSVYDRPTVLLPRKGSIANVFYVDGPFWNVDTIFYTVIDEEQVIPRYLYHVMMNVHIENYSTGSAARPSLTQSALNKIEIPVPSLEIQSEIVRILDSFSSLEAELEAELEARRKQYAYYRDELLTFDRERVLVITVGELCDINRGRVMSKGYLEKHRGAYPVYSSQTANNGRFGFINSYDYDGEYITWTTDGANAGSVFYHDEKFSITNVCGLLRIKDSRVRAKYLKYVLDVTAKQYVNTGMGNPKLMSNVMKQIKVGIPSLAEQDRIISILDRFDKLTNDLSSGLPAEIEARRKQYEYYRDRLLSFDELAV